MEGPTPISALIHAATMVTAGIFMVARMSPLYELSATALSSCAYDYRCHYRVVFMGFLGVWCRSDIKTRCCLFDIVTARLYDGCIGRIGLFCAAIFHLMTHAFFKALLLFLAAGSVIIAMHHEQNIWKMGNLRKYMPITWFTSLIGTLALVGNAVFRRFLTLKTRIIEAVQGFSLTGAGSRVLDCVPGSVF